LFETDRGLARYIAPKGSACLDGVSLTVNEVEDNRFSICVIPHTLEVTTLGDLAVGENVNLEVDLIARYLDRLTQYGQADEAAG
jgi:riboflavin synthase